MRVIGRCRSLGGRVYTDWQNRRLGLVFQFPDTDGFAFVGDNCRFGGGFDRLHRPQWLWRRKRRTNSSEEFIYHHPLSVVHNLVEAADLARSHQFLDLLQ
jgi:hypothetical protein